MVTSRERLQTTLEHRQPDRVCVDVGSWVGTTLHASTLSGLRQALLGDAGYRVKIIDPLQVAGEVDEKLRRALGLTSPGCAST